MRHFHPVKTILTALCLVPVAPALAQLTVSNALTPAQLVQNVLLGGGVTASNITFNGAAGNATNTQIGSFDGSSSIIGLASGIIMASGDIQVALGPNDAGGATEGGGNFDLFNSDPDLALLNGLTNYDKAVLEFDFIPTGDSLKFRYVFSSEEYDEYVCGTVNDVFGFFLSGPGLSGPFSNNAVNIALIPGTNVPVSINTVNNGTVGFSGTEANCSDLDPNWQANSVYYQSNATGNTIQFDGTTVILTAFALVQCGQPYHIKMAIADGGDTAFDSGVFLEAGSFTSTGQVQPTLSNGYGVNGDILLEGCGPYELVFTRLGDLSTSDTVTYLYGGTATSGVDFLPALPNQMIFGPGVESLTFLLDAPLDADGDETLVISVEELVACAGLVLETVFTFQIQSAPPLQVNSNDINGTCGETHVLAPTVTGGLGQYVITWANGEVGPSISVTPTETTSYVFTVDDICGVVPVVDSITVVLPVPLPLETTVSAPTQIPCLGTAPIEVFSVTGGNGVYSYEWTLDGVPLGNTASINVPYGPPLYYVVTVTDGCGASTQDSVLVSTLPADPIVVTSTDDVTVVCAGDDATVGIASVTGASGVLSYSWRDASGTELGTGTSITVPVPVTASYLVEVTDQCGNTGTDTVSTIVPVYDALAISASDPVQVPCLGTSPIEVTSVLGGNGVYTYQWSLGTTLLGNTSSIDVPFGPPQYYTVVVTDGCGSSVQDSVLVSTQPLDPIVITTTGDATVVCAGDTATISILSITGGSGVFNRTWRDATGATVGTGTSITVPVPSTAFYTIEVVDQCANTASATVGAILPQYAPLSVTLPPDQRLCFGDSLLVQAVVTGGSGYYTIAWMDSIHADPVRWEAPTEDLRIEVDVLDRCGWQASSAIDIEVERVIIDIVVTNQGQDDWYLQAASEPYARTWLWDMGDGTRYRGDEVYHSYLDTDDHWVTLSIITPDGCQSTDSVLLKPPAQFHFPNAFTPDGDGINDLFLPVGAEIYEYQLEIFDRWGELIHSSADVNMPWDGSVNGSGAAMTGVYVYKYRVSGLYFAPLEGYGHVTLLRGTTSAP
jgi:gliding motility-associated-like protein